MVILTKLSKKDFEELLTYYNIGNYVKHKHIEFALGNTNYILSTTKGRYVVKIFEMTTKDKVRYILNIEEYMFKNKVNIPKIILTKKGKDMIAWKNKPLVVYEFVEGSHTKRLTKEFIVDMAKKIGLLHQKLLKLKLPEKSGWPLANKLVQSMKVEHKNKFVKTEMPGLIKKLKSIKYSKLKKSIIHGDLTYINFLVKKNKLKALLDWADTHKDFLIYDLAILFAHTFMSYKRIKKDEIKLFMKHYQRFIKLNSGEKRALFTFIKVRLMGVILWHEMQRKKHPDQIKRIKRGIFVSVEEYKLLNKLTLENFLKII